MKLDVFTIGKLLESLSLKTGKTLDHAGLNEISEMIPGMNSEYLYKKLLQEIRTKKGHELHGVGSYQLNQILTFLGFKSLAAFREHLKNPVNERLLGLIGIYYSYVRANHQQGVVLRSPVRIYEHEVAVFFELKGNHYSYNGEISERDGCMFVLMKSMEGKSFHHVYKIGTVRQPKVLQGVFSGVSSAFDPIGGRALLIRQDEPYERLSNRKEKIELMLDSGSVEDFSVATYFKDYCNNNVSPGKSSDFGFDDLL
jgi:hypothetical protein